MWKDDLGASLFQDRICLKQHRIVPYHIITRLLRTMNNAY